MKKPIHILIVEDSAKDAMLLVAQLERGGFDPIWQQVATEDTMRTALAEQHWDIVFSDHAMPRFDSRRALRVLRERHADVPFVIVSGVIRDTEAVMAMREGAQDYVTKDNPARLIPVVERELRAAQIRIGRQQAELDLQQSESLVRIAGRLARLGGWAVDLPNYRVTWSEEVCAIHDVPVGSTPTFEEAIAFCLPEGQAALRKAFAACATAGTPFDVETEIVTARGQRRWLRVVGQLERDAAGEIVRVQGACQEITDIKQAMHEKDVLLREIHHRVKNNLQIISSLVSLQADMLGDDRLRLIFGDVRDRVRSMALVHEKLYQTGDLARLNFADYATSLLHYLWSAHGSIARNVRLELALTPVKFSIDVAMPCGLMLHELASNAIKHGFPEGRSGKVQVGLEQSATSGKVCLRVRDDGVGMPAALNWQNPTSLGLRLVQILARQLGGTFEYKISDGTEISVCFPGSAA